MTVFPMTKMRHVFFLLILICSQDVISATHKAFYRSFLEPYYRGKRLNYCTLDGKMCGLRLANHYCRMMGYQRADQQIIAYNVGLTNYLNCPATCTGWRCNGFKMIRCVGLISHKPPSVYYYRKRRFVYPRFNNYRVDWCYNGGTGCGYRAAHSFCRRLGYTKAYHYSIQKPVFATQAIGNQKLCFGPNCKAFKIIDCYR